MATGSLRAMAQIEGCESRIRSACDTIMTQAEWCEVFKKALDEAKKGRMGMLASLLPIVARKIPEGPSVVVVGKQEVSPAVAAKLKEASLPNAATA